MLFKKTLNKQHSIINKKVKNENCMLNVECLFQINELAFNKNFRHFSHSKL